MSLAVLVTLTIILIILIIHWYHVYLCHSHYYPYHFSYAYYCYIVGCWLPKGVGWPPPPPLASQTITRMITGCHQTGCLRDRLSPLPPSSLWTGCRRMFKKIIHHQRGGPQLEPMGAHLFKHVAP